MRKGEVEYAEDVEVKERVSEVERSVSDVLSGQYDGQGCGGACETIDGRLRKSRLQGMSGGNPQYLGKAISS